MADHLYVDFYFNHKIQNIFLKSNSATRDIEYDSYSIWKNNLWEANPKCQVLLPNSLEDLAW